MQIKQDLDQTYTQLHILTGKPDLAYTSNKNKEAATWNMSDNLSQATKTVQNQKQTRAVIPYVGIKMRKEVLK